ncbi:hypothetical protein [Nesterenkonia marinintestina]|uniref:hypothetical protein n=1 Tax=Nesterenkonia marinintestina TaxID=2979865 RepID=UPI0021BFB802|nr:hypothetical protein [Nesterenkonia sp. GX14115]
MTVTRPPRDEVGPTRGPTDAPPQACVGGRIRAPSSTVSDRRIVGTTAPAYGRRIA